MKQLYPDPDVGDPLTSGTSERSISGTYDGYSGTFSCPSECDIASNAQGDLTFSAVSGESWTFTSTDTTRDVKEEDTEFLYFRHLGIRADGSIGTKRMSTSSNGPLVGTQQASQVTNLTPLQGTAEFTGGAIGKYALAKVGGRAARIGTFTATATFNATFDGSASTISGRITDFKEGGS